MREKSQTNQMIGASRLKHDKDNKNSRPTYMQPDMEFRKYDAMRFVKDSATEGDGDCPDGSRWSKKLKMCIEKEVLDTLKQKGRANSLSVLTDKKDPGNKRPKNKQFSEDRKKVKEALLKFGSKLK